jgi:hypothetical protein
LVAADGLVHLGHGQVVDPVDGEVVRHDPSAGAIGADPDGATVYFAGNDAITARSSIDGAELGQVAIETVPNGRLAVTPAGAVLSSRTELWIYGDNATTSGFVPPGPPAPTLDWAAAVAVDVNAIRVVAAPDGSSFFAVGGYVDPKYPSHVVEIDAATGDIVRAAFVGALVSSLEVSRDGSTLIATSGLTHEVTEIDTATFDINRRLTLQGAGEPGYGGDILPLPGDADRYLVVTWSDVDRDGSVVDLLLVDAGLAASVPQPPGPPERPAQLALDEADPTTVWAHEENSGDLHRLVDDGHQVTYAETVDFLCCYSERLEWSEGSLYTSTGHVADVEAGRQTGTYPASGIVLPLPDEDRALVFGREATEMDLDGYQQLQSYQLPVQWSGYRGVVTDVARIGDLLAVTYEDGPALLVPFAGTAPPAPTGFPPPPPRCLTGFPDVPPDHPFCNEIAWLSALTVTETRYGEAYRPGDQVTRQALAAMLHRMAGRPPFHPPSTPTFPDVTGGPFRLAIEWAASYGLFNGYADGTFRPTTPVSRQAAAAVLHRSVGSPTPAATASFTDVLADHPFRVSIQWMAAAGIADGYADGTFRSALPISRQAAAAFIIRTLQPQVAATFSER